MDVAPARLREVVVDDELDTLEVHSPAHHVRANQAPDLALRESSHDLVPLLGRAVRVNAVGIDAVEEELGRELFGAKDRLDEDEDGRSEGAFGDEGTKGEELVVFGADELEGLGNGLGRGVPARESVDVR